MKRRLWLVMLSIGLQSWWVNASDQPIRKESGFSGFVMAGISSAQFASNVVAGSSYKSVAESTINNLSDGPDKSTASSPVVKSDLKYTFAESRTELFLGSALEDLIRYDFTAKAGVRQGLSGLGIVSVAYLFSAIPSSVWSDPFVTGQERDETDRTSSGLRLGWSYIARTPLSVELSQRKVSLDEELSGADLLNNGVIDQNDMDLLKREGTENIVKLSWTARLAQGHVLVPELKWVDHDLDGKAVSRQVIELSLSYLYHTPQYSLVTSAHYGHARYDKVNPVFAIKNQFSSFGLSLTGSKNQLFGIKPLSLLVSLAVGRIDADINFYDSEIGMLTAGLLYRF